MIHALTFDFWDTIALDNSDEPKRAAAGLPTKARARLDLFRRELQAHHPGVGAERAHAAWEHAQATYQRWWKVEHRTPTVATRLDAGLAHVGLARTPGFDQLVAALENMEVQLPPNIVPGAADGLSHLAKRWPLGIVSDAIVTPGVGLRQILDGYGILGCFSHFVFSDEVGAAKPDPAVFHAAAAGLGVPVHGIVHVGDREANDIAGPANSGARSVLFTGAIDRGAGPTKANGVAASYPELITVLEGL